MGEGCMMVNHEITMLVDAQNLHTLTMSVLTDKI